MTVVSKPDDITATRRMIHRRLDDEADFVVCESEVTFRQTFETVELSETFSRAPPEIVDAARKVLTSERIDSLTRTVRETIRFSVGCNTIPLFANVSGGRGRTLFEFRCVFEGCSAFFDVRMFSGVDRAKWAVMGVSHCHSFCVCSAHIFMVVDSCLCSIRHSSSLDLEDRRKVTVDSNVFVHSQMFSSLVLLIKLLSASFSTKLVVLQLLSSMPTSNISSQRQVGTLRNDLNKKRQEHTPGSWFLNSHFCSGKEQTTLNENDPLVPKQNQ